MAVLHILRGIIILPDSKFRCSVLSKKCNFDKIILGNSVENFSNYLSQDSKKKRQCQRLRTVFFMWSSLFFFFLTANFTRDKSVRYMCQNEEVQAP